MPVNSQSKVMTAREAVARFVAPGCVLGMGGQNVGRIPMALTHEILRQGIGGLTILGCNLSIAMDLLVGAGLVRRTESGTGNLERFGTTFQWRRAIEAGVLQHRDYSHLAMVSRFLAGEMGLPFMPTKSLLGSDILNKHPDGGDGYVLMDNPWGEHEPVALLPAACPDVAIIHAQRADELGNVIIEGFAAHDVEMVRASRAAIVSCEEVVSSEETRRRPELTAIPYLYVSAVVEQPFGGHPTSVYRAYDFDSDHLTHYQACAREGGQMYQKYLERYVLGCDGFDDYLERIGGVKRLHALRQAMQGMM
ncbi:MAG: CoA transferase subunit A [Chloroflexi bacterium]|nr:CoA transferase subunit A [Chloroflexota bacterium]